MFVDSANPSYEIAKLKFAGNSCLVWGTISLYVALIVDSATPVTSPTSAIRKNLINGYIYIFKVSIDKLALVIIGLLFKHS